MIRALIILLLLSSCGGSSKEEAKVVSFDSELDALVNSTKFIDNKFVAE